VSRGCSCYWSSAIVTRCTRLLICGRRFEVSALQILARVETTLGEFPRARGREAARCQSCRGCSNGCTTFDRIAPAAVHPSRPLHNQSAINLSGGRKKFEQLQEFSTRTAIFQMRTGRSPNRLSLSPSPRARPEKKNIFLRFVENFPPLRG
jgi:hypothetical protein